MSASVNNGQRYSDARGPSFFQKPPMASRGNLRTYCEMALLSAPIPPDGGSLSEPSPDKPDGDLSANDVSGHRPSTNQEGAAKKSLLPICLNARRVDLDVSRSISIPNPEYAYAVFPIAIAFSRGKRGREIANSKPVSMIFPILTHCLNKGDINNYFVRTMGPLFCLDAMSRGSSHLAP